MYGNAQSYRASWLKALCMHATLAIEGLTSLPLGRHPSREAKVCNQFHSVFAATAAQCSLVWRLVRVIRDCVARSSGEQGADPRLFTVRGCGVQWCGARLVALLQRGSGEDQQPDRSSVALRGGPVQGSVPDSCSAQGLFRFV